MWNSGGAKSHWPVQKSGIGFTKVKKSVMKVKPMYSHIPVKAHTNVNTTLSLSTFSMLKEMVSEKESFHFLTCVSCLRCSNTWCLLPPACDNCFELEGNTLFMVIVGDLLLTIIMMVIVYRCTNKKSSAGPPQPSKGKNALGQMSDSLLVHLFLLVELKVTSCPLYTFNSWEILFLVILQALNRIYCVIIFQHLLALEAEVHLSRLLTMRYVLDTKNSVLQLKIVTVNILSLYFSRVTWKKVKEIIPSNIKKKTSQWKENSVEKYLNACFNIDFLQSQYWNRFLMWANPD